MLALSGVTVPSLEHAVTAPFTTRQLADLGARVIKVERLGSGDLARQYDESVNGASSYFVWLNRSKESIALDVKSSEGREVLHELAADADVVVQNLDPGAAARLGMGAEELRAREPRKIVVGITGCGSDGPWADRKAYDLLVQSETELVSLTGTPDEVAKVAVSIADIAASMYAFSGKLAALYRRQATGKGASIEVSLFEALAEWVGQPAHFTAGAGRHPGRFVAQHATIAPYGPYIAADGKTILLGIQNEPEWTRFCKVVLLRPELAANTRFGSNTLRVRHPSKLNAAISDVFSQQSTPELERRLTHARIAFGGVNTVPDFLEQPVLAGRDRWRDVDTGAGMVRALLPPIELGVAPRMDPVPALGEHTGRILAELGRDPLTARKIPASLTDSRI